ncbi:deoxynucleotide monophosphate kinase [Agrobacterium burrii]|uniref:Deoxynucleotide monophosphate kinase n=1 Tax=Agrobacterium burrii TaxID=2815339 RepID=A0ABS3EB74_9HYPH|nr:deoxynucleotide monophosphate kinase [Agrobacterium burrii]MBO0129211.1 deoxynucleotide monophosphate kinase [Agrobacterium burrii]
MTIASKDAGCLTAVPANDNVPAELRALGAAIGKASTAILPPVIALTGLAGSGKSTASKYLVENHGYQLVKFAGPLKGMLRAIGLSEQQIEGNLKETPCEWLQGMTPRHAMQTLGTQWGRDCIGQAFWIDLWVRRVYLIIAAGGRVVVDDCRFSNEADEVRKLGGVVWQLVGRGGIAGSHESEAGCGGPDMDIRNTGVISDLHCQLDVGLKWHLEDAA